MDVWGSLNWQGPLTHMEALMSGHVHTHMYMCRCKFEVTNNIHKLNTPNGCVGESELARLSNTHVEALTSYGCHRPCSHYHNMHYCKSKVNNNIQKLNTLSSQNKLHTNLL